MPGNAFELCPSPSAKQKGTRITNAEQLAACRFKQVRVLRSECYTA